MFAANGEKIDDDQFSSLDKIKELRTKAKEIVDADLAKYDKIVS